MTTRDLRVYGSGGFGREVRWLVESDPARAYRFAGYLSDDGDADSPDCLTFEDFSDRGIDADIVIAIGDPRTRNRVIERTDARNTAYATLVHDGVRRSPDCHIGIGSIVCSGSQFTVNITLGEHVHVNLNCTIGHDVSIGRCSTLSPGVHVSGNVIIEPGVFIGTGAVIANGRHDAPLTIGAGCVIGAGAVVMGDTQANTLYLGVPAKPIKRIG